MFDIKGDKISLNTEDLAVPPFKEHYNGAKDKSVGVGLMADLAREK